MKKAAQCLLKTLSLLLLMLDCGLEFGQFRLNAMVGPLQLQKHGALSFPLFGEFVLLIAHRLELA